MTNVEGAVPLDDADGRESVVITCARRSQCRSVGYCLQNPNAPSTFLFFGGSRAEFEQKMRVSQWRQESSGGFVCRSCWTYEDARAALNIAIQAALRDELAVTAEQRDRIADALASDGWRHHRPSDRPTDSDLGLDAGGATWHPDLHADQPAEDQ